MKLNKKIILGLALLSLVSVVYLIYSAKKSPPPPALAPGIESTNSETRGLIYKEVKLSAGVQFPDTPSSLPVYPQNQSPFDLFGQAQKLARFFGLKPAPDRSNLWLSDDQKSFLSLDSAGQTLIFQVDGLQSPESYSGPNKPTVEKAVASAENLINSFADWEEFKPDRDNLSFFQASGPELVSASRNVADVIEVSFFQRTNDFPIQISDRVQPPVAVLVGQKNQVVKVTARPQTVDLSSPKNYPSVGATEALEMLKQGQGKIIQVSGKTLVESSTILKEINQITVQKIGLEYRLDSQAHLLVPYYNFQGVFTLGTSAAINDVVVILPVVRL